MKILRYFIIVYRLSLNCVSHAEIPMCPSLIRHFKVRAGVDALVPKDFHQLIFLLALILC
jgi:hypothetical protein